MPIKSREESISSLKLTRSALALASAALASRRLSGPSGAYVASPTAGERPVAQTSVDLDALTADHQLDFCWSTERLSRDPAKLPLTPEQMRELDARGEELEADIRAGRSLGEPWSEVRKRFK